METNQEMPDVLIKLADGAIMPSRMTDGAAGHDMYLLEDVWVRAIPEVVMARTGVSMAIPDGWEGQIRPRSSLCKRGIVISNSPGTIDSDYRGEITFPLRIASGFTSKLLQKGERIGQIVFQRVNAPMFVVVDELPETDRAEGGYGSTGQ